MKRVISILLVILIAIFAFASVTGALAASPKTQQVTIKTKDANTGKAIGSVKVKIYEVYTEGTCYFHFDPATGEVVDDGCTSKQVTKYVKTIKTNASGVKTIDLEPGDYKVVAYGPDPYFDKTKKFTVESGNNKTVTIKLTDTEYIQGEPGIRYN